MNETTDGPTPPETPDKKAPEAPRRRGRWVGRLMKMVAGIALGLGIAEGAFWMRDKGAFPHLNVYVPDAALGVRLRPGATQRITFGGNPITSVRINKDGLRGADLPPPSPEGGEILVVGDSQVFGLGVEESETFSAELARILGGSTTVVNAGVPTYGPPEYNAVAKEMLEKRKSKTVIYVINVYNDLFEAGRPNTERHRVWDGWAVRAETAPSRVASFPGRELLYNRSHALFAWRKLWYERGPQLDDNGFASEGTWKDIAGVATRTAEGRAEDAREIERLAGLRETELAYAEKRALIAKIHVEEIIYRELSVQDGNSAVSLRAARANPGDIVAPAPGEEARQVVASAEQIRQGALMRARFESALRKKAEEAVDSAASKEILGSLAERDAREKSLVELRAAPVAIARESSGIARAMADVKALCDAAGARLVVVALPMDVQVSAEEWKKYGATPVDMEPTKILLEDIVATAEGMGALALDATRALAAAEPGAFLDRDLHMTPKGHKALAEALAQKLKEPPKAVRRPGLPLGRSRVPRREEWDQVKEAVVQGSTAAGCETKIVREWLRVTCRQKGVIGSIPSGVELVKGGHGDALAMAWDGVVTLIAPVAPGDSLAADFFWKDRTQRLFVEWPAGAPVATEMRFEKEAPAREKPPAQASASEGSDKLCACHKEITREATCKDLLAAPDADCLRTYGSDCGKLLACASGEAIRGPTCAAGFLNAGAAERCRKDCSVDGACPAGVCTDYQGVKVCITP